MTKYDGLIEKVYYDPSGYGTAQEIHKDANKIDRTITIHIVRAWFERNVEGKTS